MRGFVPTRRFADVAFATYEPDPAFPSQREALERLRAFAGALRPSGRFPLLRKRPRVARAIYLDGGYGVGKTHLLAATYAATTGERRYLSFAELAYTITRLGMQAALAAFKAARLVCIDEFELDDVAQTRMAAMFLGELLGPKHGVHVVTTSNTLPQDLGQGRFAAAAFQREIGELAALFEIVSIDGEDYRHRQWDDLHTRVLAGSPKGFDGLIVEWAHLQQQLGEVHPVHYGQLARQLEALFIRDIERIDDQAVALRLVHLVDKLYDQRVRLGMSSHDGLSITDLFGAYRHGGYEKKYRRCLSRLQELLAESATRQSRPSSGQAGRPAADPGARQ